jgi:hypothetical protein
MNDMREGQLAFNLLYARNPALADRIRGTSLDPFYDDSRLSKFRAAVAFWESDDGDAFEEALRGS